MNDHCTRKNSPAIKVYCTPEERAQLQANASAVGESVSHFLLQTGLGCGATSADDYRQVEHLIRVHADQGRLAGLFKLWLTNDERVALVGEAKLRATLDKIEATRDELRTVIRTVVTHGPGPKAFW
jgi:uncharacterized protein (DUF1778 family)